MVRGNLSAGLAKRDLRTQALAVAARYVLVSLPAHLVWEVLQLPLYTIWYEGSPGEIAFAVMHCTGGDGLIAAGSLGSAVALAGRRWPTADRRAVAALTIVFGMAYTVFSEWLNVSVRGSWAYAEAMPVLPWIGTGLAPLAQWLVVPLIAMAAAGAIKLTDRKAT